MNVSDAQVRDELARRNLSLEHYPRVVAELHGYRPAVDPVPPTDAERQQFIDDAWRLRHFRMWIEDQG
jgi:hypothetical protein